jgi:hypothetical protein
VLVPLEIITPLPTFTIIQFQPGIVISVLVPIVNVPDAATPVCSMIYPLCELVNVNPVEVMIGGVTTVAARLVAPDGNNGML